MCKVMNKKLHPYYKTGIYGWIGEEIDDNDYIVCPICGDVLGVNYCDYSAEQGYYDKCPKCKQELDYSEIYDFEDTCYFEQLLEIKDDKLALTEKALELACLSMRGKCDYCKYKNEHCPPEHNCSNLAMEYFIEQAKEMMKSE